MEFKKHNSRHQFKWIEFTTIQMLSKEKIHIISIWNPKIPNYDHIFNLDWSEIWLKQ